MDRSLLKLYVILAASLSLVIICFPMTVAKTAGWAMETMTRAELTVYSASTVKTKDTTAQGKGNVVIIMDDGWETQYTCGYQTLKQYNFKACISVIPATVNEYGYMSYRQLADLYMDGWDLLNHTYNHLNLLELSEIEQTRQINMARKWLSSRGFGRGGDIVIFPQGKSSKDLTQLLKDQGFVAARTLNGLWSAKANCTLEGVEIRNLISSISLDAVKEAVNKAINNQSTVILILHKIEPVTENTQMQLDEKMFNRIVEYLASNEHCLNVITMTELLAGGQGP